MWGIHRWPVNFPHKGPVTRNCFHLVTSSWGAAWPMNLSKHVMLIQCITSRLDNCNSLLLTQRVMTAAARLLTKTRKFDHITPVLCDSHWLPVSYKCQFKILLLVFKYIHKLAPTYPCKRLTFKPKRDLKSDNKLVLDIPAVVHLAHI